MSIEIKEASKDEIEIVYCTMVEAFKEYIGNLNPPSGALSETTQDILNTTNHGGGSVIAWDGLLSVGSARFKFFDDYIYIGRVAVLPVHRGKGVCKSILTFLEKTARERNIFESRVEVRLSIPDNIEIYKKFKYEIIEQIFYPDQTDSWYVMTKKL